MNRHIVRFFSFDWFRKSKRAGAAPVPAAPATVPAEAAPLPAAGTIPAAVDAVLDELLAGKISRDEAETRILEITQPHVGAPTLCSLEKWSKRPNHCSTVKEKAL